MRRVSPTTPEQRLQRLLGDRTRFNEIDWRWLTRDASSLRGALRAPIRLARTVAYESAYELWRRTAGRGVRTPQPILMYGMPHSGTSITMELFAHHPDLANKSEINTILQPHGYFDMHGGENVRTADEATPEEVARLHQRFEFTRRLHGKQRVINKSPNNTVRIDFLKAVFPDGHFIHVLRDGRAVVNSLIRSLPASWETADRFKPWRERANPFPGVKPPGWRELLRDDPVEQHALQWVAAIEFALAEEERVLRGHVLHIRYEELCADVRGKIGMAWRFAGLSVDDAALALLPERLESKNFKWTRRLTQEQIHLITEVQTPLLRRLGYDPALPAATAD